MVGSRKATLAERLAKAMQYYGLAGFPRNYELFYEAFTGNNPELTLALKGLDKRASQGEIDVIIRKFLTHHFENVAIREHAEQLRRELTALQALLRAESRSISNYSEVISEFLEKKSDSGALQTGDRSANFDKLDTFTKSRLQSNHVLTQKLSKTSSNIESIDSELVALEVRRFQDPATGMANRRAFNRDVAGQFSHPPRNGQFAVSFLEPDNMHEHPKVPILEAACHLATAMKWATLCCANLYRFDGWRFAMLSTGDGVKEISSNCMRLQEAVRKNSGSIDLTISIGNYVYTTRDSGEDVIAAAEKSLMHAQRHGPNSIYTNSYAEYASLQETTPMYRTWLSKSAT